MAIFALGAVLLVCSCVFLIRHFHKFKCIQRLGTHRKVAAWLLAAAPVAAAGVLAVFDPINVALGLIHLMVVWAVCDLVGHLVNKARGVAFASKKRYAAGAVALALTAAYLGWGAFNVYDVRETHYNLSSENGAQLRILQISDAHVGTTFDGDGFATWLQKAQACNPDVIVVTGDLVDDGTNRENMERACEALGALTSTYGTYFVYGNHDKGYYNSRGYSAADLVDALQRNGVIILEDETVALGNKVLLMGCQDKSERGRASMEDLMAGLDPAKYVVVLDHQPGDYAAQERSGANLVLSGHTHGGQMLPIGQVSEALGINDATYGLRRSGATDFIVSSGISDWELKFKTGTFSEYVVIDVA